MAILKSKAIKNMGNEERKKQLKELRLELVKSRAGASKTGSSKTREAKKAIARILTFNRSQEGVLKK